jgi:hypothetical protein
MDTKFLLVSLFIIGVLTLNGCKNCESDEYGAELELIVPIETTPLSETIRVGDTLWITADFDKEVMLKDRPLSIRLDDFNFFSEIVVSEITDTTENYSIDIEIIEEVGQISFLPLQTAITYPVFYEEREDSYHLKGGIVFNQEGLFFVNLSTQPLLYEDYEHSAMYQCEDKRRRSVRVCYANASTNVENYENVFLQTNVDYLLELMDYEAFESIGSFALRVER